MVDSKTCTKTTKSTMTFTYQRDEQGLFVCPHCDYKKSNQSTMHYHLKKHEEQLSHICKLCKKGFLQKQTLDLHIRSKHPELLKTPDAKKYSCCFDNCTFSSLTKGNMVIHCIRIHFQEEMKDIMKTKENNELECEACRKEFYSSSSFYYHAFQCLSEKNEKRKRLQQLIS
jgi:hypothetical protein